MKNFGLLAVLGLLAVGLVACGKTGESTSTSTTTGDSTSVPTPEALPAPWGAETTYQASECSITINPTAVGNPDARELKDFMYRDDVRYVDLRDAKEGYADHVAGFESVSYFGTIVGTNCLFRQDGSTFVANYQESEAILNRMFPKDQTYFFMCQSGARVSTFLKLLDQLDYDMSRCYDVGGWNHLKNDADHCGLKVSQGVAASAITYDFSNYTPVAAESTAAKKEVKKAAAPSESTELPAPWGAETTYQASECSITINPTAVGNPDARELKDFMYRDDVRYVDLRDAKEGYADHVAGFESVSYFGTIVGTNCLFRQDGSTFVANYQESEAILNRMFPKDQTYFFMCQSGARVSTFLKLLDQLDYDMSRCYDVGGWNHLKNDADHCGLKVSQGVAASAITYDFSNYTSVAA